MDAGSALDTAEGFRFKPPDYIVFIASMVVSLIIGMVFGWIGKNTMTCSMITASVGKKITVSISQMLDTNKDIFIYKDNFIYKVLYQSRSSS